MPDDYCAISRDLALLGGSLLALGKVLTMLLFFLTTLLYHARCKILNTATKVSNENIASQDFASRSETDALYSHGQHSAFRHNMLKSMVGYVKFELRCRNKDTGPECHAVVLRPRLHSMPCFQHDMTQHDM